MRQIASIFLIFIILPMQTNAQDYTDALRPFVGLRGMGAWALALGGAYTAVSNDYTSSFWNPSGLARIYLSEVIPPQTLKRVIAVLTASE